MKLFGCIALSFASIALGSAAALAAGQSETSEVSVSGGISTPSTSTAVFQNPAGLAGVKRAALNTHAFFPESAFKDGDYGGGILYGNGSFGMTAGAEYAPTSKTSRAYYGLAVTSQSLHLSLGAAGFTPVSPSGDSTFNLGLLLEPSKGFRLGATALGISGSPDEYGLGLAIGASADVDLVADVTVDDKFNRPVGSPGIRIGTQAASLTVSYGFKFKREDPFVSSQIRDGVALGGGLRLGQAINWQVYYNQLSKYGTTLSFDL